MLLLALALAAASPAIQADASLQAEVRARVARSPRDIRLFIERRANCNHFLGEEPYDRERAAELNKAIRELRCATVDRDERRLCQVYRRKAAVLRLLDDTEDALGW
jgi:hypothetical protein